MQDYLTDLTHIFCQMQHRFVHNLDQKEAHNKNGCHAIFLSQLFPQSSQIVSFHYCMYFCDYQ